MLEKSSHCFYITLVNKDDSVVGYMVSSEPPILGQEDDPQPRPQPTQTEPSAPTTFPLNFRQVFDTFISAIESYRKFITLTLDIGPSLSSAMASQRIQKFANSKGVKVSELSNEKKTVYKLANSCYREFSARRDEIAAFIEGSERLPEIVTIGLVSTYDAFLGQLLNVVLSMHPEIVLTSEKSIKFSDLSKFHSIDDARSSLIGREIESVIRSSHQDQFGWMENRFSTPLRKNLSVWPDFVELCERRNLLTHTGGIVSSQYMANCKMEGVDLSEIKIGTKLVVDGKYFSKAVSTIYEIGVKLCHVLWRKFAAQEREVADDVLSELSYNLMCASSYELAESLLKFGTTVLKKHSSDRIRRMMIVNYANAVRLQGRDKEAEKILAREDWTASDHDFAICVAAVLGNVAEVVRLMPIIGAKGIPNAEDYRTWPVFRGLGSEPNFTATFEELFSEPFVATSAIEIQRSESADPNPESTEATVKRAMLN